MHWTTLHQLIQFMHDGRIADCSSLIQNTG